MRMCEPYSILYESANIDENITCANNLIGTSLPQAH